MVTPSFGSLVTHLSDSESLTNSCSQSLTHSLRVAVTVLSSCITDRRREELGDRMECRRWLACVCVGVCVCVCALFVTVVIVVFVGRQSE